MEKKLELIRVISFSLLILILLRIGFWPTRVDGHSMMPTFDPNDYAVISKIPLWFSPLSEGDLIVARVSQDGEDERVLKRVIALSGDHVVIKEDQLYVNGLLIEETYKQGVMLDDLDYYVPADSVFILGDNRTVSKDSRIYGCISMENIKEKVLFKLF